MSDLGTFLILCYDKGINFLTRLIMEYAIIEIGGTQVWVQTGQHFITNKVPLTLGTSILLKRILMIKKADQLRLGFPYLKDKDVSITGTVVEHLAGPKLIIYKMKSKKKYRRKKGHRQQLSKILVNDLIC